MIIKYTNNIPTGYIGMNYYAAKELGFKQPDRPNVILVKPHKDKRIINAIIKHEKSEIALMKSGMRYYFAHELASPVKVGGKTFTI
jgi:hypothetical protein